jgi:hypothetical protein
MPIKGVIFILLLAAVLALAFRNEIYSEIKKLFTDKKDEDKKE